MSSPSLQHGKPELGTDTPENWENLKQLKTKFYNMEYQQK